VSGLLWRSPRFPKDRSQAGRISRLDLITAAENSLEVRLNQAGRFPNVSYALGLVRRPRLGDRRRDGDGDQDIYVCQAKKAGTPAADRVRRPVTVRSRATIAIVALAVGLVAAAAAASSGSRRARPDPTFGAGQGWVTTRIPGASSVAYGAAVIEHGRIVVAGQATSRIGGSQIVAVRYLRDGRLDTSFGSNGVFETALPQADGPFIANAVAVERSTGRLLIAGGYGQGSMLVLRLTPGGQLDPTFGQNQSGFVTVPIGGVAQSIAIERSGEIVVGGSNGNRQGRPMVVARLTRNGALDHRFGQRGLAQVLFWNAKSASSAGVSGLATAPHGGVIASGHLDYIGGNGPHSTPGHGSAGVFRLSPKGRLMRSFGSAGHVEIAFRTAGTFAQWFPCAMTVDSRNRITVTGDGSTRALHAVLLSARLSRAGKLDRSYGRAGNGRAVTPGLRSGEDTTCGATTSAAGSVTVGVGSTLARLLPDGTANGSFARGGVIRIAKPRNVGVNAVARSGSRRIVIAGSAGDAVYVARYRRPG